MYASICFLNFSIICTFFSDGRSMGRMSRRQAAVNKEGAMNQIVIPRTQWVDKSQCQPMDPHKFACILIEKLEIIKKDRETQELLEKKLSEVSVTHYLLFYFIHWHYWSFCNHLFEALFRKLLWASNIFNTYLQVAFLFKVQLLE